MHHAHLVMPIAVPSTHVRPYMPYVHSRGPMQPLVTLPFVPTCALLPRVYRTPFTQLPHVPPHVMLHASLFHELLFQKHPQMSLPGIHVSIR